MAPRVDFGIPRWRTDSNQIVYSLAL